jgi:hypothetical protein
VRIYYRVHKCKRCLIFRLERVEELSA